jgi:hypothetical protein
MSLALHLNQRLSTVFHSPYASKFCGTGKIQTIYPWSTGTVPATEPPEVWFHDILNADGSAFNASETAYIRSLTLGKN